MWDETKKIIEEKFKRSLRAHKDSEQYKKGLKELFEHYEIPFNSDTSTAYLLGILGAISYDTTAFVESRGMSWGEPEEIVQKLRNEIRDTANRIVEEDR